MDADSSLKQSLSAKSAQSADTPHSGRLLGDLNCDGSSNLRDINPFVLYLSNLSMWQAAYPGCPPQNGDANGDGTYPSVRDINAFLLLVRAYWTITGRITHTASGSPFPGVRLVGSPLGEATTDVDGYYEVRVPAHWDGEITPIYP